VGGHSLNCCALGHQHLPAELAASPSAALDTSEEIISRGLAAAERENFRGADGKEEVPFAPLKGRLP
jgi:hypothetical protein